MKDKNNERNETYAVIHNTIVMQLPDATGWSSPQNLGSGINSDGWEMAPVLTRDSRYLMFTWRQAMETTTPSQIRWISMEAVQKFKPEGYQLFKVLFDIDGFPVKKIEKLIDSENPIVNWNYMDNGMKVREEVYIIKGFVENIYLMLK